MTTPTPPDGADAGEAADRQHESPAPVGPEPPRRTRATASERAAAQTVRDVSEPERLDGSQAST